MGSVMSSNNGTSNRVGDDTPLVVPVDDDGFVCAFDAGQVEEIQRFLDKYGVVCVRGVLDESEIDATCTAFFSGFDKDDDASVEDFFARQRFGHLGVMGMMSDMSLAALQNRQSPKVHSAFAAVLGEQALIVDHDRFGALRPTIRPAGEKPEWRTIDKWLHLDCNPASGYVSVGSFGNCGEAHDWRRCRLVQSFIALTDARDEDGGFHCVPGSHKHSPSWAETKPEHASTLQVDQADPVRERIQRISVRRGCLLVWDSFLFHANRPNHSANWRLVQYIRMYPAHLTPFTPLFTDPSDYPAELAITPLGRRLFGLDPWPAS
eukprot:TRINITY_DN2339_c0_g1_i1.p1 TRINITY_DN2339_c0_g1~~TRINITY_DN2339_c0_g1_i1.p1  ORF type:complete len:320 (-),score=33.37 TRINITY_DN2339_c0_g1_i1:165-1124(-)